MMKRISLVLFVVFIQHFSFGQAKRINPIPWVPLREGDVTSHWVIEREIDTRLKQNKPLEGPGITLYKLLENGINSGNLQAYANDSLTEKMNHQKVREKGSYEMLIQVQMTPNPEDVKDSTIFVELDWSKIKRFRIREHILFNKAEGRMYYRIEWIAPLFMPPVAGVAKVKEQPLCYIKYYDPNGKDTACFRNEAVYFRVFNPQQVSKALTFDDFFEMRMFESKVVKENNAFGYALKDFDALKDDPVWQMLHGQDIHQEKHRQESDSWEN